MCSLTTGMRSTELLVRFHHCVNSIVCTPQTYCSPSYKGQLTTHLGDLVQLIAAGLQT